LFAKYPFGIRVAPDGAMKKSRVFVRARGWLQYTMFWSTQKVAEFLGLQSGGPSGARRWLQGTVFRVNPGCG